MIHIITAAQKGAELSEKCFDTLLFMCNKMGAKLHVIPLEGINKKDEIDPRLIPYLVHKTIELNASVIISDLIIPPATKDPLSGLDHFAKKTTVFGATKLFFKSIPTSNYKLPKIISTTGCITLPYYKRNKSGDIAREDHSMSAVIINVKNEHKFDIKQLEFNSKCEVNYYWKDGFKRFNGTNKTIKKAGIAGLVIGDSHVEVLDELVKKATRQIIEIGEPEELVAHDILDSYSINHHHEGNLILKAKKAIKGENLLQEELNRVGDYLVELQSYKFVPKKVIVVRSNHDEALDRYLKEARFATEAEAHNTKISLLLAYHMIDGYNPLEAFIKKLWKKRTQGRNKQRIQRTIFLKEDSDYSIAGIKVDDHGHRGNDGGKGSIKSQSVAHKKSFIAHSHSPKIFFQTWQVGTSTRLKLEYNKAGASSWINTHGVIFDDGTRTLINIIEGSWY